MDKSIRLRRVLDAAFEALCETHEDELPRALVEALTELRATYDDHAGPLTEDLSAACKALFEEASEAMGDHALWNQEGAGYVAVDLLREGVR